MLKQTRFFLGLVLIVEAISCFFLAICFLFKDKKNTALPVTALGIISAVAGGFFLVEKIKERFDEELILDTMNELCDDELVVADHDIPVDDTASESDFN